MTLPWWKPLFSLLVTHSTRPTRLVSSQTRNKETGDAMSSCPAVAEPRDEEHEVLNRWNDRWRNDRIGWHSTSVNPALLEHLPRVLPSPSPPAGKEGKAADARVVLVPLCGKSVDLTYLAQHPGVSRVVGVEGIQKAIEEFAAENPTLGVNADAGAGVSWGERNQFVAYRGRSIGMIKGDFFDLDSKAVGGEGVDVVWDRGSMVAIEPSKRREYVETLAKVTKPGGSILLCTVDRREGTPEAIAAGPPYSVNEEAVRSLYEHLPWVEGVEKVGERDELASNPSERERWEGAGLKQLFEVYFVIRTKTP